LELETSGYSIGQANHLGDLSKARRKTLIWICGAGESVCEQSNEYSGSTRALQFLDQPSDNQEWLSSSESIIMLLFMIAVMDV
jgi:hypothetical protein